ncbi:MAG: GDP-L-fucose synthase family protein [Desulfovibrio sp.]|uniref:GDP-L-fucose synthase family protein n=1 Tax=Desulfovibrio sp. 7SRBS1 TaxID=3378064 RepID=UPI003B3F8751
MEQDSKIYVAGHRGLVGSALVRALHRQGYDNLVLCTHAELDLCDQKQVRDFFDCELPDYVFVAAAKVGGILANSTYPAEFITTNLAIATNVIETSWRSGVKKLLFLGSSCIYPKHAPQPMTEDCLLTGPLEPTNEWYAIAKIAGLKMCAAYRRQYGFNAISAMPTNLYGPEDNFHPSGSHVIPGMLRRFHEAKLANAAQVAVWGDGSPLREFLHVDDLADACLHLMRVYEGEESVNVGSGVELSIRELAEIIADVVGFTGEIVFDTTKPNGMPRKLLDISKLRATGWEPSREFRQGLADTYRWYVEHGE